MSVAEMLEALAQDWTVDLRGVPHRGPGEATHWTLILVGPRSDHSYRGANLAAVVARAHAGGQDGWVE